MFKIETRIVYCSHFFIVIFVYTLDPGQTRMNAFSSPEPFHFISFHFISLSQRGLRTRNVRRPGRPPARETKGLLDREWDESGHEGEFLLTHWLITILWTRAKLAKTLIHHLFIHHFYLPFGLLQVLKYTADCSARRPQETTRLVGEATSTSQY